MSRVIGRAFKISDKDTRSYDRVSRPRSEKSSYRKNPMGVTTLAQVNGRGAYSARAASSGRSKSQRRARARKVVGGQMQSNASRARFVRAAKKSKSKSSSKRMTPNAKTRGKRVAAYNAAVRKGMSKDSARRSALRKVPFTANERKRGASFMGSKARAKTRKRMRPNQEGFGYGLVSQSRARELAGSEEGKKEAKRRRARMGRAEAKKRSKSKGKRKVAKSTKSTKKKSKKKKSTKRGYPKQYRTVTRKVKSKRRSAYGKYKRARLYNPRTGKTEYSYMYRTKSGNLRRIPTSEVVAGSYTKSGRAKSSDPRKMKRVMDARSRASKRLLKEGGVFVANASAAQKRAGRRAAAFNAARASGKRVAEAARAAVRKVPFTKAEVAAGRSFRGYTGSGGSVSKSKKKAKSTARRGSTKKRGARKKSTARRGSTKRGARKKSTARRGSTKRGARKKSAARRGSTKKRGARKKSTARRGSTKRGARKKSYRRNGKRRMRKNAFMAQLGSVLKTGTLVAAGYLAHKGLTTLACMGFDKFVPAQNQAALAAWKKPICGAVVGLAGVGLVSAIPARGANGANAKMAIAGGMVASWIQSLVIAGLTAASQPKMVSALSGYTNSMAYSLRGRGRRGMGGMASIMPRYSPVGAYMQAAAGTGRYMQAAAGTGEYFQSAMGEYFAPASTEGVGSYEQAGPLAMQAAAGTGQVDDGIRPDQDLDRILDLAESAAGLGEYITAGREGGDWVEERVPTDSQWIPNGPLWAGELKVRGNIESSELPAGTLAGPGGNGILSAP